MSKSAPNLLKGGFGVYIILKYRSDRIKLVTPLEFISETEGEA